VELKVPTISSLEMRKRGGKIQFIDLWWAAFSRHGLGSGTESPDHFPPGNEKKGWKNSIYRFIYRLVNSSIYRFKYFWSQFS
jgi:hypothetical protein